MAAPKPKTQAVPVVDARNSTLATQLIARWEAMKSARLNFMVRWDDAARYIQPRKGNILTKYAPGQDQTINLYDTTAEEALLIAAAGTMTHITPAGEKWFALEPLDEDAPPEVIDWLADTTERLLKAIYASNFYLTLHEDFLDLFCFGTSCLFTERGKESLLNFVNIPVGTFAIDENADGITDVVVREWKWSARQAEQRWGFDNLGPTVQQVLRSNKPADWNRQFTFMHFVEPRDPREVQPGVAAGHMRAIRSVYICIEDKCVVEESGYYSAPYAACRILRGNNELYGRGPGIQAMPEIKLLNAMERDILTAVEKLVNPPWMAPDDTSAVIDGRPNGITYWDASQPANKPEQMQLKNQIDLGEQKTEQKRQRVRRAFYNDLFQLLTNIDEQKREKTAYEVQQMVAEKLLLFSPLFARIVMEKLTPTLARCLDILHREGALAPAPAGINALNYQVSYKSKIALAIKAAENQSFATMLTLVEQAAALDPSVAKVVKWREGVRDVARNVGLHPKLIRNDREVDAMVQEEQKMAAAEQAAKTGEIASRAAKNLGPEAQQEAARRIINAHGTAA